ncbi:structural cement protein Gp24 [Lactobacillus helveticus]|uniref:structural cement protein Gp24 n=1 Tax=Lactobacillus helveticus TaxID=1587 RepID=UPI00062AB4E6|nr:hypothetical protein [Lactobacillus helveticus]AKG66643.1 hypothetical protein TU99_04815 [Lactobacillus helveticus]
MGIPDGLLYGNPELGAGEIATIDDVTKTTEQAGTDIGFGQGVQIKNGLIVPATAGNIYGIAVRRTHVDADHLTPEAIASDEWHKGELLGVVREGTVAVPLSADVNSRENAAVDSNGNFKPAGPSDTVVGVFLSSGNKGGTARLQTTIQLTNTAVTGTGVTNIDTADTVETTHISVSGVPSGLGGKGK